MHITRATTLALLCTLAFATAAPADPRLDGAVIVNSGSTNTVGWRIAVRSNGVGTVSGAAGRRRFSVPSGLALKFLNDAQAARDAHAAGRPCMKSASFGTRLNVLWHGWTSPDLSCPVTFAPLTALSSDVSRIVDAANPSGGMRRIRLPIAPHRAPTSPPKGPRFAWSGASVLNLWSQ
ncbi:MAG: hypothetical protein ACYC8W_04870 [Candidatus Tyrphobacter sp.]